MENLTLVTASSWKELDNFITTEFFHNPNIQNEENVALLGDFSTDEEQKTISVDFVWRWRAPKTLNAKGWKTVLCFAEYDKREHSLQSLCKFPLWIQGHQMPSNNRSLSIPSIPLVAPSPSPPPALQYPNHASGQPSSPPSKLNRIQTNHENVAPLSPSSPVPHHHQEPENLFSPVAVSPPQNNPILSSNYDSESIDKVLQKERKAMAVPRPDGDSSSQPEDGPLFRATIASLEKRTGNLKMKIKKLLKRGILMHERQQALVEAERLFLQSLKDAADTEVPGFQSIVHNYFDTGAKAQIESLRMASNDLSMHVIEPLRRLYDLEIKSFDNRKREFDDESSQYYSWLSRYLSMKQEAKGKKKVESDSKYLDKRKAFELCRFDYYSYMQDLHGGRKQQDVTYQLALFAESEVNRFINTAENLKQNVKPSLESIIGDVKDANKDWSRQRTEREVRRRQLERSIVSPTADSSPTEKPPNTITTNETTTTTTTNSTNVATATTPTTTTTTNNINNSTTTTTTTNDMTLTQGGEGVGINPATTPPLPQQQPPPIPTANETETSSKTIITNSGQPHLKVVTSEYAGVPPPQNVVQTPLDVSSTHLLDSGETDNNNSSTQSINTGGDEERKKEGLLWAMSRPNGITDPLSNLNKAGWHKFWVVLAGGKLCEYTNWKQSLDLHNEPINLKVALVREARNAERRFCFEVVTPNYKRVYQATNEEDMHSWIRTINEAISLSLEGSTKVSPDTSYPPEQQSHQSLSQQQQQSQQQPANLSPKIQRVFSRSSGGHDDHNDDELRHHKVRDEHHHDEGLGEKLSRKMSFHKSKASNAIPEQPVPPTQPPVEESCSLIETLKRDSSNQQCADCGGTNKVEWISINLLALVCIDCSGIHRSLGTHISKIRSLRLDTVSFTPEVVELIKSVSNQVINGIWEQNLDNTNNEKKRRQDRMGYITEKYIEKKFLETIERPNARLREAVKALDLQGMLAALANRANPNMIVDEISDGESVLLYSLRVAGETDSKIFPLTELLLLNSATLPTTIPNNLSPSARQYLAKKIAKEAGSSSASPCPPDTTDKKNVGSKIQKRLSVGFSGNQNRSVS